MYCYGGIKLSSCSISVIFRKNCQEKMSWNYLSQELQLNAIVYLVSTRGVLPIMAYTGRLRPKGVPFSGFKYKKG